jgi:DNA-binding Lrp family transcriptional regulator
LVKSAKFDRTDVALLRTLQQQGRITNSELARTVSLAESSCLRRVRQMEHDGVIERYAAIIDQRSVGLPLNVFVTLSLTSQADAALKTFEREVSAVTEVMECYLMTGTSDYLLRVVAADVDDLERIHSTRLSRLSNVSRITSSLALRQVVRRAELPVTTARF